MPYSAMELAEVFIKTGELDDALNALNQQLNNYPDDINALRLRASVLLRYKEPIKLEMALKDLAGIVDPSSTDLVQQSIIYEQLGRYDSAIASMKAACDLSPDDERMLERQVDLLIHEKHYDEALSLIKQAPETWRWMQLAADVYVRMNQHEPALRLYQQAQQALEERFEVPPPHIRATLGRLHLAQANSWRQCANLEGSLAEYKQALEYLPDEATIRFNMGLIFALQGDLSRATEICRTALAETNDYLREMMLESLKEDAQFMALSQSLKTLS